MFLKKKIFFLKKLIFIKKKIKFHGLTRVRRVLYGQGVNSEEDQIESL